jgi:hypothetical protein
MAIPRNYVHHKQPTWQFLETMFTINNQHFKHSYGWQWPVWWSSLHTATVPLRVTADTISVMAENAASWRKGQHTSRLHFFTKQLYTSTLSGWKTRMYGVLPNHKRFTPTPLPQSFVVPIIRSSNSEIQVLVRYLKICHSYHNVLLFCLCYNFSALENLSSRIPRI